MSGMCVCTHVVWWHVFLVSEPPCLGLCWFILCLDVFVHCCVFIQPVCLLPLLTWPPLFSSPPDRQYAWAPPQSFIGSYCPLTQIQYASIDCVEMQSGSPQQRSKQSKFNKTPPPAFSQAPDSTSQRGTNVFMCAERNRGSFTRSQLLLDTRPKKPVRLHKQSVQEVTSVLTSLPAKHGGYSMLSKQKDVFGFLIKPQMSVSGKTFRPWSI